MEPIALMEQVVINTDRVVSGVSPSQLGLQSPCAEWTVRAVINHITGGATVFAICLEEGSVPAETLGQLMSSDNLGPDYVGAWQAASKRALAAFGAPGALEKMVQLPFGEVPARMALNIATFDVLTHAADIASVTGQTIDDSALIDSALEIGRQMIGSDMRRPGVFEEEQPVSEEASPTVRLLGFAGRKV